MKTLNFFTFLVTFTLLFSSCSTNEPLLSEEPSSDLLDTYKIGRDEHGAYFLDYSIKENTQTETVIDPSTNTKNIYLYPSDKNSSKRKFTQDLTIEDNQFNVGFVNMKSDDQPQISIIDDNRFLAKSSKVNKLDKYSISKNKEGVFILDFSVKNNVRVDFVFNEASKIYEIHLEQGKSPKTVFSRVLEKVDGQALKFDFINHNNTFKTGDDPDDPDGLESNRKPRIIII
jgi:hypothetical protein